MRAGQSDATYRLHLDYAAPFVGRAASCADPAADAVVARRPEGHHRVGRSEVRANLVRFLVPLDDLRVGGPAEVPVIRLWADSRSGGVLDHASQRETGDGCAQPRASTETLA